jgi:dynein heavy chain
MKKVLGNDVTIRKWGVAGLPSDNLSVENGIIMFGSRRWPLMIDPQTQANKFIKTLGKNHPEGLEVFKPSHPTLIRDLEFAIQFGKWVLLENIGQELDPALEPVLLMQLIKVGTSYTIKVGDKSVPYNANFKFFLTTTLPNPHYSPETSVKVTLLNFAITPAGLEEQMLNLFVMEEMPELQEKKNQIVADNAKNAQTMYELEDKILATLSEAEQVMDLLETDNLIDILADSKVTGDEIAVRKAESEVTEKEIDVTRESFRQVAYRASLLFFCIVDLNIIDPMYQYSLQWFQRLFRSSVKDSQPSEDVAERVRNLNEYQTLALYQNVCRSLFERHKLLFSLLLCMKILFGDNKIDHNEWRFFLTGASGEIESIANPTDWLDDLEWNQVHKQLYIMDTQLPVFAGILEYFINFHKKFKKIFDAQEAHEEPLPGEWNTKLNSLQKMIVLKAIRPDKVTLAMQNYISEQIGQQYIEPPVFRLNECFRDSSNITPLVFVLSAGSDPVATFMKLCQEMDMLSRFDTISLGQGQGKKAEAKLEKGRTAGWWILLQNCHLCVSFMPRLEAIVE